MKRQCFSAGIMVALALCGRTGNAEGISDLGHEPAVTQEGPAARLQPGTPASFRTRHGYFTTGSFSDLPGWHEDDLGSAWLAFRQSCQALQKRSAWQLLCKRSGGIDSHDDEVLRRFFEDEFVLYEIYNPDLTSTGVVTGYYEPLLHGSRHYGAPYVYPVHGVPDDMLYLDARSLPAASPVGMRVRIQGANVIPAPAPAPAPADQGLYTLHIAGVQPDIRGRKYRLRVDGDKVVPYFSRQDIERGLMSRARVIAWVRDQASLYSMQIQGSGKIRLPDGDVIRVAYGEFNGHPFLPSLQALPQRLDVMGGGQAAATRGLSAVPDGTQPTTDADAEEVAPGAEATDAGAGDTLSTRGMRRATQPGKPASQSEVDQVIAALLPPDRQGAPPSAKVRPPAPAAPGGETMEAAGHAKLAPLPDRLPAGAPNGDPSYVFFRQIPDNDKGPIGALGVPLTPGRSLAVDPRTTPLGSPVFISTTQPGTKNALNKLMLAQDTGGAILGAVRADYFWGFGADALTQASRMKGNVRMWLLLPKNQKIPEKAAETAMRGMKSMDDDAQRPECFVPDPELCVE